MNDTPRATLELLKVDQLITPVQLAEMIGAKVNTLAQWRLTGKYGIPHVKIGDRVRYRTADIRQFIADYTIGATRTG